MTNCPNTMTTATPVSNPVSAKAAKSIVVLALLAPFMSSAWMSAGTNTAQFTPDANDTHMAVFAGDFQSYVVRTAAIPTPSIPTIPTVPAGSNTPTNSGVDYDERVNTQNEPMLNCTQIVPRRPGVDILINQRFCPVGYRSDI